MIVLAGMHRSGTTYLGEVLGVDENTVVIHEPFNRRYGIYGNPAVYLDGDRKYSSYLSGNIERLRYRRLLVFKRSSSRDDLRTRILRCIIGGKTERQWFAELFRYHVARKRDNIVIKDPFLSLSLGALDSIEGVRLVCLIRHPGAIWTSIKNMGWTINLNQFGSKDYTFEFAKTPSLASSLDEIEKFSIIWAELYGRLYSLTEAGKFKGMVVKHEELCVRPKEVITEIYHHLGMTVTSEVLSYIERTTSASSAEKDVGELHKFDRNSRTLVDSWRNKISEEEKERIFTIVEPVFSKFYSGW